MLSSPVRCGRNSSHSDPAWWPWSLLRLQLSPGPRELLGKQIPFTSVASSCSQVLPVTGVVFGRGAGSACGTKASSLCKREVLPACLPALRHPDNPQ